LAVEQKAKTRRFSRRVSDRTAREFADRWREAWNSRQPDRVVALCTDDVVWDDPLTERPEQGSQAVARYLERLWTTFPDLELTWLEAPFWSLDQSRIVLHWRLDGTMLGPIEPQGFAPTGRRLEAYGIDLFELRDGLVHSYTGFFDALALAQQIGLLPASGTHAERLAVTAQRLSARIERRRR
jgi:steroid delta-isomerase-like uncharacterized protein